MIMQESTMLADIQDIIRFIEVCACVWDTDSELYIETLEKANRIREQFEGSKI